MSKFFKHPIVVAGIALGLLATRGSAASSESVSDPADKGYRLSARDNVEVSIFDEPDLRVAQRIDAAGQIRVPLLGTIKIGGMTVREAEDFIETAYVENRILRRPMATVRVVDYAAREVSVHGAVASPGSLKFPPEINAMDIIEIIARSGGFAENADGKNVRITRTKSDGTDEVLEINVEGMITGRRRDNDRVLVYPGDVVFVPNRVW
jgi:protein involved in polysaccharide export with SLBB domain